jgi:hypothetical protein
VTGSGQPSEGQPQEGWYADPDGESERLRYWDGERWTDRYSQRGSSQYWADGPQGAVLPLGTLVRVAIAGLVFAALAQAMSIVADLNRISLDQSFLDGGAINPSDIQHADDLDKIATIAGYAGLVVGAACFIPWFNRAYGNLTRLGFRKLRYAPGWAVGGWFIPIVNLFRPKQIANDIYRASTPGLDTSTEFWKTQPISGLLSWWWGLYIASGLLAGIGASTASTDDTNFTTALEATRAVREEKSGLVLTSIASGVGIVAAILAIKLVTDLTQRQEEAARARELEQATL